MSLGYATGLKMAALPSLATSTAFLIGNNKSSNGDLPKLASFIIFSMASIAVRHATRSDEAFTRERALSIMLVEWVTHAVTMMVFASSRMVSISSYDELLVDDADDCL